MNSNPTEEIKQIRHELGRQAEFSVHRIFADLRIQRQSSGLKCVDAVSPGTPENAANICMSLEVKQYVPVLR